MCVGKWAKGQGKERIGQGNRGIGELETGKGEGGNEKERRRVAPLLCLVVGLVLSAPGNEGNVYAQECPEPAPQTSGSHSFRHVGESFDIPVSLADCQAIALTVRWANGRNNGSLFNLTFLDSDNRPLYMKQISAFLTGTFEFPLLSFEQPYGSLSVMSIPAMVTIQAVPPFGLPATLSYTVTRVNRRSRPPRPQQTKLRGLDSSLFATLQTAPGVVLAETPAYTLSEIALAEPRELELRGKGKTVRRAFRLLLKGEYSTAYSSSRIDLVWLDDVVLPAFRIGAGSEVGALIFDEAVLKSGVELAVSNLEASKVYLLPERLKYESNLQSPGSNVTTAKGVEETGLADEGNVVVEISNALRVIGGRRQPLVQIHLRTSRPFPARESALRLQVGKRFFLDELSGDHTGRSLTLTLTPEMFAELREGADIVAFFNRPDRSGYAAGDVWYFGRLKKSLLH